MKCDENSSFVKIANSTTSNVKSYCLHYAEEDCWTSEIKAKANSSLKNHVSCTQCKDFYEIANKASTEDLTLVHKKIDHCAVTMTKEYVEDSTLECVECEADYWLNGQVCTQRTANTIENCRYLKVSEDKC